MTAQQVAELGRANELPLAASYPEVDVQTNAAVELSTCSVHRLTSPDETVPAGRWEISYRFSPDHPWQYETVCGADCAHDELTELRDGWGCLDLRLHLPADWVSGVATDAAFADIEALIEHLENMPNTADTWAGRIGFEECRQLAVAAAAQIGMKRIGDLERRAA